MVCHNQSDYKIGVIYFFRGPKCLDKACAALGNVLEFIDEDMVKGAVISPNLGIVRCPQDHILKIDSLAKPLLVFLINRLKNVQKGFGAPTGF